MYSVMYKNVHACTCTHDYCDFNCSQSLSLPFNLLQSPTAIPDVKEKFQQLAQATDEVTASIKSSLELVTSQEEQVMLIGNQLAEHEQKLTEVVGVNKKLQEQFDHIEERDLLPDQLQTIAVLQQQIESLEDQVIDRDAALQEIESQMKQDYEQHDQLISKLKFQVSVSLWQELYNICSSAFLDHLECFCTTCPLIHVCTCTCL